jgi:predicted nuclease of predicted toxin-antitoxin system
LRVLFDKNVPHGIRHFLDQHQVETVDDRGWDRIGNGELIQVAEASAFDVVVTADQNIVYQQNLRGRRIALVVLGSNIWPIVRKHEELIRAQINSAKPGSYVFLEMPIQMRPQRTEE